MVHIQSLFIGTTHNSAKTHIWKTQLSCVFMESLSKRCCSTEILLVNSGPYSYLPICQFLGIVMNNFDSILNFYYWFEVLGRIWFNHTHTLKRFYLNIIFIPDSSRFLILLIFWRNLFISRMRLFLLWHLSICKHTFT